MYSDWSILSELFLGFVHLSDEINEAFSSFWHSLLRPVSELELADCSGLAVLRDNKIGSLSTFKRPRALISRKTDMEVMYIVCKIQQSFLRCFNLSP